MLRVLPAVCALALVMMVPSASAQFTGSGTGGANPPEADPPADEKTEIVDGLNRMGDRIFYVQTPKDTDDMVLLVWCHPASGDAQPEFKWLKASRVGKHGILLLCPQAAGRGWSEQADSRFVKQTIDAVVTQFEIDPEKIILGGHSSGGHFSYRFGLANPQAFHMVVPAAGALTQRPRPATCDAPLFHLYHSTNDQVVPFKHATESAKTLTGTGYVVALTRDNQQHNVGPKTVNIATDAAAYLRGRGKAPKLDPQIDALLGGDATAAALMTATIRHARLGTIEDDKPATVINLKTSHKLIRRLTDPATYDFEAKAPEAVRPWATLTFEAGDTTVTLSVAASARQIEVMRGGESVGKVHVAAEHRRAVYDLVRCALKGEPVATAPEASTSP